MTNEQRVLAVIIEELCSSYVNPMVNEVGDNIVGTLVGVGLASFGSADYDIYLPGNTSEARFLKFNWDAEVDAS